MRLPETIRADSLHRLRTFFHGMLGYEFERQAMASRASLETMFMATTFGGMLGLPVIPPYYGLRLLPHILPRIAAWKRRVLRERELTDRL